jgi:AbrB family looped-hinge helix DNA binding protein
MPIVKIRTNRQVSVPKVIFDDLGLKEGDFVEVNRQGSDIVIRPKRLVDLDDTLSPEEESSRAFGSFGAATPYPGAS